MTYLLRVKDKQYRKIKVPLWGSAHTWIINALEPNEIKWIQPSSMSLSPGLMDSVPSGLSPSVRKNIRIIHQIVHKNCVESEFKRIQFMFVSTPNSCWLATPNVWTCFRQYFQKLNVNVKRTQWVINNVLKIIKWFKMHDHWGQLWAGLLKDCN